MNCKVNCVPGTEYEYYLKLLEAEGDSCVGNVITINFDAKLELMLEMTFRSEPSLIDMWNSHRMGYNESGTLNVAMCLRHWLELASMLSSLARKVESDSLKRCAYQIVVDSCKFSGYDYKEILPYMTSMLRLEHKGDLYQEL